MKKVYSFLAFLVIAVLFFQCQKNLSYVGSPDPGVPVNPDPVTANIQGNVIDENDNAAAGVTITVGNKTLITDANGFFHINGASLDKNTTLVTAQKDGYFKSYRVFAATSGCNQVVIKLTKRNLAATISGSSGGNAGLPDGSNINLPANAVVNASSGSDYSGDIKVYASYINPRSGDISKTVPGSFVANDKNGKRMLLSSFGMLAVELESSAGEKLQIKQGSVAKLTIPISSSAIAKAPATISLWYIDEKTGIWQEEGTATKTGNAYTGTVKHFSFWNCDYAISGVNLSMTLKTPDNLPLVNATVKVTATADSAISAYGWTDSLGQVKGLVPANEDLKLEVLDNCNEAIYTKNISPLTQDDDLGVINITNANSHLLTFAGTLIDCSSKFVKNGYAVIKFNGITRYTATDANGKFITDFVTCSGVPATATILGVDEDAQQQGQVTTVVVASPVTNAGNITACGTLTDQYINYTIDDSSFNIAGTAGDSAIYGYTIDSLGFTSISAYDFAAGVYKNIQFETRAVSAGTYPLTSLTVQYRQPVTTFVQPSNVEFTSFPSVSGEFYEGSISGKFLDSSVEHTISATFRVRRN